VDLLDVKGQPKVFEVNSSPALPDMEAATGMDLATPIIERAEALVAGEPPLDARPLVERGPPAKVDESLPVRPRRKAAARTARKISAAGR